LIQGAEALPSHRIETEDKPCGENIKRAALQIGMMGKLPLMRA
jgi:hypothetical protein